MIIVPVCFVKFANKRASRFFFYLSLLSTSSLYCCQRPIYFISGFVVAVCGRNNHLKWNSRECRYNAQHRKFSTAYKADHFANSIANLRNRIISRLRMFSRPNVYIVRKLNILRACPKYLQAILFNFQCSRAVSRCVRLWHCLICVPSLTHFTETVTIIELL